MVRTDRPGPDDARTLRTRRLELLYGLYSGLMDCIRSGVVCTVMYSATVPYRTVSGVCTVCMDDGSGLTTTRVVPYRGLCSRCYAWSHSVAHRLRGQDMQVDSLAHQWLVWVFSLAAWNLCHSFAAGQPT